MSCWCLQGEESATSQGLDLAGLQDIEVETLGELFWEPGCELEPYEAAGESLEAASERLLVPSWTRSHSASGKKWENFLGWEVSGSVFSFAGHGGWLADHQGAIDSGSEK